MAYAGIILGGISLLSDLYSQSEEQKALDEQQKANKKANLYEAQLLEDQAEQVGEAGVKEEYDIITEGKQFIGQQRASTSGSGTVIDTGTNADLLAESQTSIEADVTASRESYTKEKQRLLDAAAFTRLNAKYLTSQGQYRTSAAYYSGVGRTLGSAATLADRWYRYYGSDTTTT